ncbi:MAG: hypothetical protein ACLQIB_21415 [Isosphaeraceae bacterium]
MQPDRIVSREGASAPYYRAALTEVPALVVFPVAGPGVGMTPEDAWEIYRVALERALAACRPSIWDLTQRISAN